jgi:predicted metal-dependent HD superfamily phosphohydrolase
MIKKDFIAQVVKHGVLVQEAEEHWLEIETAYLEPGRYFHDLSHLEYLLIELIPLKPRFEDWETTFFSLVYHDVVYDVEQHMVMNDNEEKSADFAVKQLAAMNFSPAIIDKCRGQIMATQKHGLAAENDTNLFTDADLSILGKPWPQYTAYKDKIRKEFSVYTDSIYKIGRRKFLETYLQREPIFKTKYFYDRYEETAKANMRKELELLQE